MHHEIISTSEQLRRKQQVYTLLVIILEQDACFLDNTRLDDVYDYVLMRERKRDEMEKLMLGIYEEDSDGTFTS